MLTMTDIGKPLKEDDLKELEVEFDIYLPEEYREFLLKSNGGVPIPDVFKYRHPV